MCVCVCVCVCVRVCVCVCTNKCVFQGAVERITANVRMFQVERVRAMAMLGRNYPGDVRMALFATDDALAVLAFGRGLEEEAGRQRGGRLGDGEGKGKRATSEARVRLVRVRALLQLGDFELALSSVKDLFVLLQDLGTASDSARPNGSEQDLEGRVGADGCEQTQGMDVDIAGVRTEGGDGGPSSSAPFRVGQEQERALEAVGREAEELRARLLAITKKERASAAVRQRRRRLAWLVPWPAEDMQVGEGVGGAGSADDGHEAVLSATADGGTGSGGVDGHGGEHEEAAVGKEEGHSAEQTSDDDEEDYAPGFPVPGIYVGHTRGGAAEGSDMEASSGESESEEGGQADSEGEDAEAGSSGGEEDTGRVVKYSYAWSARFIGHANRHTDIKEAVFMGPNDQYVVAGSDCGHAFIWERRSGRLVRALKADEDVVNCCQGNPAELLLATSGIEDVIRLWRPNGKEWAGRKNKKAIIPGSGRLATSGRRLSDEERGNALADRDDEIVAVAEASRGASVEGDRDGEGAREADGGGTYINTYAHANEVDDDPPAYAIGRRSRLERLLARNLAETQRRQSWSSEEEVGEGVGPLSVRSQNVISLRQLRELLEQRQEEGEEAGVAGPGQTAVACRQQ